MNFLQIIFFFISKQVYSLNTLVYETFTQNGFDCLGWNRVNECLAIETNTCGSDLILGGYGIFRQVDIITNLMALKPHSQIQLSLNFWKIDAWGVGNIYIFIDGIIVFQIDLLDNTGSDLCGLSDFDEKISIDQTINHNFNTALIVLKTEIQNSEVSIPIQKGYWGINNFRLYIEKCPIGCSICNEGDDVSHCLIWQLAFQSLTETTTLNTEGWSVTGNKLTQTLCSNIPLLCGYNMCGLGDQISKSVFLLPHTQVKIHFRFFKIDSWDFEIVKLFIDSQQQWSKTYFQYQYYDICGWVFYELGDNIEINLQHSNQEMIFELMNNLDSGPQDESLGLRDVQIYINNRCSILYYYECCSDQIIQAGEECDDGNMIPFDGCHNCMYSCIEGCQLCVKGICLSCQNEFLFNQIDNTCQIIIKQQQYDNGQNCLENCANCQFDQCRKCIIGYILVFGQCQLLCITGQLAIYQNLELQCNPSCINFDYSDCLKCSEGFFLYNNRCAYKCENGSVKYISEKCDTVSYDPPIIYECAQSCQICQYGICLDECEYGFYEINNRCETKCGDGIIAGVEQCDNNQQNGCLYCQYSCPKFCDICIDGICLECQYNYSIDFQYNICFSICGDQLLVPDAEMCDDGNQISGDGCSSKCILEKDWVCVKDAECVYNEQSQFKAKFVNQINEYQYVSITFTQKNWRSEQNIGPYQDFISIKLLVPQPIEYSINIIPIYEATTTLNWINYQVEVIVYANLEYRPQIQIDLQEQLYNQNNLPLANLNQVVLLNKPQYLSDSEQNIAQQLKRTQTNLIYSLGGLGVTLLLCGFGSVVWSNLDMLQEYSYLRYINVNFPINLMIFFDSADVIQLQYFINKLTLFFFYSYLEFENQQSNGKFNFYEINASLAINIQSFIFSLLSLMIFYFFIRYFSKYFNAFSQKSFEHNFLVSNLVHVITFRINKIIYMTTEYGFNEIILKNGWNFLFMIFIQIFNVDSKKQESVILFIASILLFFCYACFIIKYMFFRWKNNLTKSQIIEFKIEMLFQLKRFCFMAILIFLQSNQVLQVYFLGILYCTYLACLIKVKIIKKSEDYKIIITESFQMIFVITSSFYLDEGFFVISQTQKICLGWFGIVLLIFLILINILYDFILMVHVFIRQIKKYLEFRIKYIQQGKCNEANQKVQIQ